MKYEKSVLGNQLPRFKPFFHCYPPRMEVLSIDLTGETKAT